MEKRRHTDVLRATLPALAGVSILDIGCGRGGLAGWLARQAAHVIGVDAQAAPLRSARGGNVQVAAATAEALPFAQGEFAVSLIFNSLHHFPQPAAALVEARRVTADHGVLFVAEPLAEGPHFEFMQPVDDETQVRASALAALAAAAPTDGGGAGWSLETTFDYSYDVVVGDLDAEIEGWITVDPARAAKVATARHEIEVLFHRHGVVTERGHAFAQPMRAWLLRAI